MCWHVHVQLHASPGKDCQHNVLIFPNESQPPLSAAFVKYFFVVNQLLTVFDRMNIWYTVFQNKNIKSKIVIN